MSYIMFAIKLSTVNSINSNDMFYLFMFSVHGESKLYQYTTFMNLYCYSANAHDKAG